MKKILVVDDKVEIRELMEVTLRMGDYDVFQAKDGAEALELARKHKPDLIIMDVMMPGELNGLETTRVLKNDPEFEMCKIIILSAKGQKNDIMQGFESGADDYFIKPFDPLDLIKKVEDILGVEG